MPLTAKSQQGAWILPGTPVPQPVFPVIQRWGNAYHNTQTNAFEDRSSYNNFHLQTLGNYTYFEILYLMLEDLFRLW
jgi:hypothetical protein